MITFPNAKINLGLHITKKRPDGFHEIESCLLPIPLFDALEITLSKKMSFVSTGIPIPGKEKDNLILKAYQLLKKDFNNLPNIAVHLHKVIPIGAGLGGGSSDAAFSLKLMNQLFDLYLEDWILEEYAAQLGSDCPFFIHNRPKMVYGRGEIMEPIEVDLGNTWLLLINPNFHIGTKEAYEGVTSKKALHSIPAVLAQPGLWKPQLTNDFEPSIFSKYPALGKIKDQLYGAGAFYASMSGSGATIFGLFKNEPEWKDYDSNHIIYCRQL